MPAHPALHADRWFASLATRRSRRAFDGAPLSAEHADALAEAAASFRPFPDARVELLADAPAALFSGIVGSYGRVTRARAALVIIKDGASASAEEHCGYTGEGLVLEARALGLDTCWVAGFFSPAVARGLIDLDEGEIVRAVSPVGHALRVPPISERLVFRPDAPKFRRPLDEIAPGHAAWPVWASEGARAARIAPSAMNRQPWRFRYADGAVVVSAHGVDVPRFRPRIDCGIAMLHFELGARSEGSDGVWVSLEAPDVARWEPFV
jgi:nitroreductase